MPVRPRSFGSPVAPTAAACQTDSVSPTDPTDPSLTDAGPSGPSLSLSPRSSRLRCVYCHTRVGWKRTECESCGVVLHPACALLLERCPTLACQRVLPEPLSSPWRAWALVAALVALITALIVADVASPLQGLLALAAVLVVAAVATVPSNRFVQHLKAGNDLLDQGDPLRAYAEFEQALRYEPHATEALIAQAAALHQLQHWPESKRLCDLVLESSPRSPSAYHLRGLALLGLHQEEMGLRDLRRAEDLQWECARESGYSWDWLNLASIRWTLRDWTGVLAVHEHLELRGLRLDAGLAEQRGNALFLLGDLEDALGALSEIQPPTANSLTLRAQVQALRGDLAAAQLDVRAAAQEEPGGWCLLVGGMIHAMARDREAAEASLRRSWKLDPTEPYVCIWLACLGFEVDLPEATKDWPAPVFEQLRGEISCEELLTRARTLHSGELETRGHLREAHCFLALQAERGGDLEQARDHYEAIVELGHEGWINYEWAFVRLRQLAEAQEA